MSANETKNRNRVKNCPRENITFCNCVVDVTVKDLFFFFYSMTDNKKDREV